MSLAQKMKLQELKAQVESLSTPRRELMNQQRSDASEKVRNEILSFFTSKDFKIEGSGLQVTASYHGGLQTEIDFRELIGDFFGGDGFVGFKYANKKFSIGYLMNPGKLPELGHVRGAPDAVEQNEIDFYQHKLIPALKELGVSDLSGDFTIFSVTNVGGEKRRKKYESVEDVLAEMIC